MFEVKYKKNVRWALTDRFPYIVVYIIDEMKVVILAVVSTRRHPKIWKSRT
jgi:toxin ParE1/3/4